MSSGEEDSSSHVHSLLLRDSAAAADDSDDSLILHNNPISHDQILNLPASPRPPDDSPLTSPQLPDGRVSEDYGVDKSGGIGDAPQTKLPENVVVSDGKHNLDPCYSWLSTLRGRREKKSSESSEGSSSSTGTLPMPPAPDGGWGWFVVLGAFLVSVICDGLAFCFGLLYSELLLQFKTTKSMTSLVGSIFFGVSMILGPLASALTTRFGCRKMTIFGGVLASFGLLLSSFANSIEVLCFTFSVIVGTGFSFCYITSVVIVAFYFEKRRALATGLAVCGTGMGTFTFAPLIEFLIAEYGWRGLFLILSGISLNLVVCGMLFRPLKFTDVERWQLMLEEFNRLPHGQEEIEVVRSRYPSEEYDSDTSEESADEDYKALSALNLPTFVSQSDLRISNALLFEAIKNSRNPNHTLQRYLKNAMMRMEHEPDVLCYEDEKTPEVQTYSISTVTPHHHTVDSSETETTSDSLPSLEESHLLSCCRATHHTDRFIKEEKATSQANISLCSTHSISGEPMHVYYFDNSFVKTTNPLGGNDARFLAAPSKKETTVYGSALSEKILMKNPRVLEKRMSGMHMGRHNALGLHLPLYRSDIFYRRLQKNHPLRQCTLGTSCPEFVDTVSIESSRGFFREKFASLCDEIAGVFKSMVDCELMTNPFFCVLIASNVLFYLWSDVPYMYAADHAIENGVDSKKASFIISIIGIANTVGQMVFGYVGDLQCNLLNVYAVVSVLAGVSVSLVPLMPSYWSAAVLYAFFGFFVSVSFPLTTVLLVSYVGMERLTNAYGLLMLMQGIANLLGPPFAGWISDLTGTYNASFYLAGIFYVMSGLVLFLVYVPALKVQPAPRRESLAVSTDPEPV